MLTVNFGITDSSNRDDPEGYARSGAAVTETWHNRSWTVSLLLPGYPPKSIFFGYARRQDAEVALQVLLESPIDWNCADLRQIRAQFIAAGGYPHFMREIADRMPW